MHTSTSAMHMRMHTAIRCRCDCINLSACINDPYSLPSSYPTSLLSYFLSPLLPPLHDMNRLPTLHPATADKLSKPHESPPEEKPQGSSVSPPSFPSPFLLSAPAHLFFAYLPPFPPHRNLVPSPMPRFPSGANPQSQPRPLENPHLKLREVSRSPTGTGPVPSPLGRLGGIRSKLSFLPSSYLLPSSSSLCHEGRVKENMVRHDQS